MFDPYCIKGYDDLERVTQKILFLFCLRFWNAMGRNERQAKTPVSVKLAADENGMFLKVVCADGEWHHVTNTGEWY